MRGCFFLMAAAIASAQTPADVVAFFSGVANELSEAHAGPFLDNFDHNMPGFATLRDEIETLVAAGPVGSVIEFVSDDGDNRKRSMELDWVLEIADRQPRRQILTCRIERRGKNWKIVALEPIDFFKP